MTFTRWAETYGPIYSIRTGATSMVVVSSNEIAKEVHIWFSYIILLLILITKFYYNKIICLVTDLNSYLFS